MLAGLSVLKLPLTPYFNQWKVQKTTAVVNNKLPILQKITI